MARTPKGYWEKRSTELMKRLEKGTENTINSLIEAYNQATKDINKEISKIFKNYAKDSELSKETLIQLLNKRETDTHYKNLLKVINNNITDESIKKKLLTKYNAPAYSYRISRYQALQDNIDVELKKLANIEQDVTKIRYVDTINEGYYHSIYDIQKGTGLGFSFAQIDNKTINLMLNESWTNKANYSQRIWNNSEKLGNYLKTQLTASTMAGKSIQKIASELADYMNVGLCNATRLVRTEVNHFANESEMLAYEELNIDKYRFIATLDNVTCEHCAELDNRVFNVKDRKSGKNYPPLHANDRCTTVAEFDDNVTKDLERRAKDENGNTILVPQDMSYNEWKEKYVTNNNENVIINKEKTISFEECKKIIEGYGITFVDEDLKVIDNKLLSDNVKQLDNLLKEYPTMKEFIKDRQMHLGAETFRDNSTVAAFSCGIDNKRLSIHFSKLKYKEYSSFIESEKNDINIFHSMPCSDEKVSVYSLTHEFGHFVESKFIDDYNKEHFVEFLNMKTRALNANSISQSKKILTTWQKKTTDKIANDIADIAIKNNPNFKLSENLSKYGKINSFEFFAECFANMNCGKPNELGNAMKEYLKQKGVSL